MKKIVLSLIFLFGSSAWASPVVPPEITTSKHLFELSSEDVEKAVSDALAEKGAGDKVAATIAGHDSMKPLFSYSKPISVEIRGLNFDKSTNRWSASVMAIAEDAVVSAFPVGGRFEEVVEVPTLKRQVRAGETISQDDVEYKNFAVNRTRAETVTNTGVTKMAEGAMAVGNAVSSVASSAAAPFKDGFVAVAPGGDNSPSRDGQGLSRELATETSITPAIAAEVGGVAQGRSMERMESSHVNDVALGGIAPTPVGMGQQQSQSLGVA